MVDWSRRKEKFAALISHPAGTGLQRSVQFDSEVLNTLSLQHLGFKRIGTTVPSWKVESGTKIDIAVEPFSATTSAVVRIKGLPAEIHMQRTPNFEGWNIHVWNKGYPFLDNCTGVQYHTHWDNDDGVKFERYTLFLAAIIGVCTVSGLILQEGHDNLCYRRAGSSSR